MAAAVIAVVARHMRTLSTSGASTAIVAGTAAVAAGWSWGVLLFAHFVAASALSKLGRQKKAALVGPIVEKGDDRDGWQVLANGGLFIIAAVGYLIWNVPGWYAIGAGALAASAADTWATEIGTLVGGRPVSIASGRPVPVGTSGGITIAGLAASFAGALFVAALAAFARWPISFAAIALGGIAGALADSFLGATAQGRRWCSTCGKATEREIHDCGSVTRFVDGQSWLDNDGVNAICSVVGALITLVLR